MIKKTIISRSIHLGCCLALTICLTPAYTSGQSQNENEQSAVTQDSGPWWLLPGPEPKVTTRQLMLLSDGSAVRGGTILVRTKDNVFATIHTSGLTPGTVTTAWFGIFNNPGNCATRPCTPADFSNPAVAGSRVNIGGQIVAADGAATYGAFLKIGDTTAAFDGPGLLNPLRAEIHLVTRTHGQAILDNPEVLKQQLSTLNGGCPPNTCANIQASVHQP
jgi:hypothetical protein